MPRGRSRCRRCAVSRLTEDKPIAGRHQPAHCGLVREEPLSGGRNTSEVVRAGDTVRRARDPGSAFAARLPGSLESAGYPCAPRFLGVDDRGPGHPDLRPRPHDRPSQPARGRRLRARSLDAPRVARPDRRAPARRRPRVRAARRPRPVQHDLLRRDTRRLRRLDIQPPRRPAGRPRPHGMDLVHPVGRERAPRRAGRAPSRAARCLRSRPAADPDRRDDPAARTGYCCTRDRQSGTRGTRPPSVPGPGKRPGGPARTRNSPAPASRFSWPHSGEGPLGYPGRWPAGHAVSGPRRPLEAGGSAL